MTQLALGNALIDGKDTQDILRAAQTFAHEYATATTQADAQFGGSKDYDEALRIFNSPAGLMNLAKQAFAVAMEGRSDRTDAEAFLRLFEYAAKAGSVDQAVGLFIPSVQLRTLWAARWYEQGMPRVVWADHKYPEMLMASSADTSTLDVVRPPWRAFYIDLPPQLLSSIHPSTGERGFFDKMLVHYVEQSDGTNVWNFIAQGPSGLELWRHGLATKLLLDVGEELHSPIYGDAVTDEDDRIFILLGRLLIGTCLTLSDPSKLREARRTQAKRQATRLGKEPVPLTRNFIVGAPTTVRVHEALLEFIEQGSKRRGGPTVRSLVRGHWRGVRYGHELVYKKAVFVEPYWRSLENADALLRPHVVSTDDVVT
jgi:hypothetical protein